MKNFNNNTSNNMETINEIWKPVNVAGYEDVYQVSSLGRVKRNDTGRILKVNYNTANGYGLVCLSWKSKRQPIYIHRLVCMTFHPDERTPERNTVNHIDENIHNNCADNLQWCSTYENVNWGTRNERMRVTKKNHKHQLLAEYDLQGNLIDCHGSYINLTKKGYSYYALYRACKGIYLGYANRQWRWVEIDNIPQKIDSIIPDHLVSEYSQKGNPLVNPQKIKHNQFGGGIFSIK